MTALRLMSHNLWKEDNNQPAWEKAGFDCSAKTRAIGFCKLYKKTAPDLIGLQEVSEFMLNELVQNLKNEDLDYEVIQGRDTPILYNKNKLEVLDTFFALHDEKIEGLEGSFNNGNTKSYTVAVFKDKQSGKIFAFTTTHLWWKSSNPEKWHYQPFSDEARVHQINVAIKKADELALKHNCPSFIVGDFNAVEDSPALRLAYSLGYHNARELATEYSNQENGMHKCNNSGFEPYVPQSYELAIDHILAKRLGKATILRFDRYCPDFAYPLSDHFPAYIDVEL